MNNKIVLSQSKNSVSIERRYKLVPQFSGVSGYHLIWTEDGKQAFPTHSFDGWDLAEDLPNGTTVSVDVKINLRIPEQPEPLPEWKPLRNFIDKDYAIKVIPLNAIDTGHSVLAPVLIVEPRRNPQVLIRDMIGKPLYKTGVRNDDYAYRKPDADEQEQIRESEGWLCRVGSHVSWQHWRSTDYHGYERKFVTGTGTVIEMDMWHTCKVLTVPDSENEWAKGAMITIYRGHVKPLS